jgi:formylglycine-generating enzyme required for sulfatase activity
MDGMGGNGLTWSARIALAVICLGTMVQAGCGPNRGAPAANGADANVIRPADGMETVVVPAGEFLMGSTFADAKASDDERPEHTVTLDSFWIDRTEVTNQQYARFLNMLGEHRGICEGHDCVETTVEDKDSHILAYEGCYEVESGFEEHPVIEVTWYAISGYDAAPVENPTGPTTGERKVFRGGSWGYPAAFLRTTERARNRPTYTGFNIGFRCATGPGSPTTK